MPPCTTDPDSLKKSNNLSDLTNPSVARDNLELLSNQTYLAALWKQMMLRQYPAGSLWITTDDRNPLAFFGFGTWERYAVGKAIVGVDASDATFSPVGKTGGSKTHTLTTDEMPAHNHGIALGAGRVLSAIYQSTNGDIKNIDSEAVQMAGGSQPHNNLQPYVAVNVWRRLT